MTISTKNRTNGNGSHDVDLTEDGVGVKRKDGALEAHLRIAAPNLQVAQFRLRGSAPYVQHKFSKKAQAAIRSKQAEGSTAKKGKKRDARDFDAEFEGALHVSTDGWYGIPACAFRAGLVSACRTVDFKMTLAKLSLFVLADGYDEDGNPLVKITKGKPRKVEHPVRVQMTTSIAVRGMWDAGWEAAVRVRFDADQFTLTDVANLLMRVGSQVGVGEGRPDSRQSTGMGWGTFDIVT